MKNRETQVTLCENSYMTVEEDGGYIILDFGKEMCGGIKIATINVKNERKCASIRVRFGESLTETSAELGEKNATNDHAPRDFMTFLSFMSTITVGNTGYRFVRIDFPAGAEITVKAILGTNQILKKRSKYAYRGEDKRIKEIFAAAKRTVDLCSSGDYIWDGVKRDRLVWIGDLYPEVLALTSMYGRVKAIESSLRFEREREKMDGIWMSTINTYNMWWVVCLAEYYFRVGEEVKPFVLTQIDYAEQLIALYDGYVDENGVITNPSGTCVLVDWLTADNPHDSQIGGRMIWALGAKKAAELFKRLGKDTKTAEHLLEKLTKGDKQEIQEMKSVLGLKHAVYGALSDEEYQKLIEGGACGLCTFMTYFTLSAIAARDKALATKIMKEYYGGMLDKGATTFWEHFDITWVKDSGRIDRYPKDNQKDIHGDFGKGCYEGFRHSLCHAWASGVIAFIKENIK
ncbi:MAG: hypothetical protein J6K61_05785 [Clostridia bacterium]|nr:hypothetical protein [Clostridia bacterium]